MDKLVSGLMAGQTIGTRSVGLKTGPRVECCWVWLLLRVEWLIEGMFGEVKSLSCIGEGLSMLLRKL